MIGTSCVCLDLSRNCAAPLIGIVRLNLLELGVADAVRTLADLASSKLGMSDLWNSTFVFASAANDGSPPLADLSASGPLPYGVGAAEAVLNIIDREVITELS